MSKYQRPVGAYSGNGGLSNRNKYQADSSAQPKVAISSTKMDGDFNYILDALNEIDTASGTRDSIAERLSVVLNDDGTLKSSIVANIDDWVLDKAPSSFTRVNDMTITFNGNGLELYTKHRRVRLIEEGLPVFASISNATYSAGVTTLTLADIVNGSGEPCVIETAPTSIAYAPISTGSLGNTPLRFDQLAIGEYALQFNGDDLEIIQNVGVEGAPNWQVRARVTSSGFYLNDGSVTNAKIGSNAVTFNKLSTTALATQTEAENGTASQKLMTAERTKQAIDALTPKPGKVLQVVSSIESTDTLQDSTSSASFVDIPYMSLSITPSSENSQILMMMELGCYTDSNSLDVNLNILRDSTSVETVKKVLESNNNVSGSLSTHVSISHLDSPNTTNEVTYKVQYSATGGVVGIHRPAYHARKIILMEISQ